MGAEGAKLAAREHNNVRSKLISQAKGRSKGLDMGIVLMLVLVLTLPEYMRNTPVFYLLIID